MPAPSLAALTEADVWTAADELVAGGSKVTSRALLTHLGRGGMATVVKHYRTWRERQAGTSPAAEIELPEAFAKVLARALGEQVAAARAESADRVAEAEEATSALVAQVEELQATEAELRAQVEQLRSELAEARGRIGALDESVTDARAEREAATSKVVDAERASATATSEAKASAAAAAELRERVTRAETALDAERTRVAELMDRWKPTRK